VVGGRANSPAFALGTSGIMPSPPDIRIAKDSSAWATAAASLTQELRQQAVKEEGLFLCALSGGQTPEQLYRRLASPPFRDQGDWSNTQFFFSDERCVPADHPDSNFHLANRTLFRPLDIASDHIHRMACESADADNAARDYERLLHSHIKTVEGWPRFHLVLLGLGQDGHTASLFPGTDAVREQRRWVTVGHAPSAPFTRLTLSLGVINQATVVLFLVTGAGKARIVKSILEPRQEADRLLPAALVQPERGRLIWLLDAPAAAELTEHHTMGVARRT
jgi:6-phosphogluconolactonase